MLMVFIFFPSSCSFNSIQKNSKRELLVYFSDSKGEKFTEFLVRWLPLLSVQAEVAFQSCSLERQLLQGCCAEILKPFNLYAGISLKSLQLISVLSIVKLLV